jgi:hypothetical protein
VEAILFELHYKFVIIPTLGDLRVVVDGDPHTTKLLMDSVPSTMAFLSTTYSFDEECVVWKGPNWECLLTSLFNCKVYFQFVIYICDREAFLHLLARMTNYQFSLKLWLEFGQYMAVKTKVPLRKESFMKTLVLFYAYVFFNQVGMNIKKDVLSSKLLPSLVQR